MPDDINVDAPMSEQALVKSLGWTFSDEEKELLAEIDAEQDVDGVEETGDVPPGQDGQDDQPAQAPPVTPSVEGERAPERAPDPDAAKLVEEKADLRNRETLLAGNQRRTQIEQQAGAYMQSLEQRGIAKEHARLMAKQGAETAWANYQAGQIAMEASEVNKDALVLKLSTTYGIDSSLLTKFTDIESMTAAAELLGGVEKSKRELAKARKAPVQDRDSGQGTPGAASTNDAKKTKYAKGEMHLSRQEFIELWGYEP
jgi:hypothetical protein